MTRKEAIVSVLKEWDLTDTDVDSLSEDLLAALATKHPGNRVGKLYRIVSVGWCVEIGGVYRRLVGTPDDPTLLLRPAGMLVVVGLEGKEARWVSWAEKGMQHG
jgi:hypothetical protein